MKKTMQKTLLTLFACCATLLALAQQRTVTGTVTDEQGAPVPNVSYVLKGTTTGGVTDDAGKFSVTVNDENAILEFSAVGYATQSVTVGSNINLSIKLIKAEGEMEGVVVTALGIKRQKQSLGYSTATVSSAELVKTAPTNFAGALYGKVPGLQVSTGPGGSTAGVVMQIRGLNSINYSSSPLIILDGIPIRDGGFNSGNYWGDGRVRGNGLIDLNPEDMENVTVLKGASASALYGSEGLNGVILITTKKGKGKGFSVDVNASYFQDRVAYLPRLQNVRGAGFPVPYEFYASDANGFGSYTLDGTRYRTNIQGSLNFGPVFDGQPILTWDGQVRPYSAQPDRYKNLFQVGHSSTQNVAISSSTDKANIRLSLTHQKFEGVSLNSNDEKFNANFNSTINFSKNYSLDVMINYINQNVRNRPLLVDRMINNFTGMMPVFDNGDWYKDKYQTSLGYKFVTGDNQSLTPNENIRIPNYRGDILDYMWFVNKNTLTDINNRLISSVTNNIKILDNLTLRGRIATDLTFGQTQTRNFSDRPIAFAPTGYYAQSFNNYSIIYGDLLLTYNKKINEDLDFTVTGGYTGRKEKGLVSSVGTNGGLSVENRFDLTSSYLTPYASSGSQTYLTLDALIGTANFNYKDYLFLEGTIRRDRTSTMNPNNNSFVYPSANASFVLSEALQLPSFWNYAKLRAAWGIVARFPQPYVANVAYSTGNLGVQAPGTSPVLTTSTITNPYGNDLIKPERKRQLELGFEASFLKSRLGMDVSYYTERVSDLILNLSLPQSMGASSILSNVGIIQNRGLDLALNGTPVSTSNFRWDMTVNFFTNKNRIVQLANGSNELVHSDNDGNAWQLKSVVGQPVGDIYVHPTLVNESGVPIITEDGTYQQDPNKMVSGGNTQAKGAGGLQNTFSYKGVSLSFNADFKYGGYIIPTGIFWMHSRGITEESLNYMDASRGGLRYYLDADGKGVATTANQGPNGETVLNDGMLLEGVLANGQQNTNIISQALYYNYTYNWGGPQYTPSSLYHLYVQKNNYIKMREIALTYSLPSFIAKKVWAKNLSLSVYARNAFYIYRTIKDMDAEQLTTGNLWLNNVNNAGSQPATRTFGATLRASF